MSAKAIHGMVGRFSDFTHNGAMTSGFDFDELPSLASRLHLRFRSGHISLEDQRMVLLHTRALGSLRKELVDTLGLDRARGLLTRMGYVSGQRDADMVRALMPGASDADLMNLGPQLHSLEGIVDVEPIHFDIDVEGGTFVGQFAWANSYEAETHLEHFGQHHESVCWMQVGYASGYTSSVMRRPVVFREPDCRGKGDADCRIVGRTVAQWGDENEAELKYCRPDRVADQIMALQDQVEHLRYSLDQEFTMGDMVGVSAAFRQAVEMVYK
ncbi:MAG: XylR N-terminal domain-containing protein, partial [Xanthomonadales bacterium]|nr:XylR N-terminal domain-containing protein [Xanthomonadales bacterium]